LPERTVFGQICQLAGDVLLQHLNRNRQFAAFGFAKQQVNMLGHDDVSGYVQAVPSSYSFQSLLKDAARL
jgi:hypothetical protein